LNGVGLCWEGGGVMGEVVGEVERGWEVMEMWHGSWRDFWLVVNSAFKNVGGKNNEFMKFT
nr:hypothetical protein [Tanacetum cinerariifolium]